MSGEPSRLEADRSRILDSKSRGSLPTIGTYVRLSGPGWLHSALTLGAGSLGSSLYLGILGGVALLWLQPFAMILGVIMLGGLSYITLSTGKPPFRAINEHVNPVLGWSWIVAVLMANVVWSLPQYALCFAVVEQNLLPQFFMGDGWLGSGTGGGDAGKYVVSLAVLALCTSVTWSYGSGSIGIRMYEFMLKVVVAVIVMCFIGVVVRMSTTADGLDWPQIARGYLPNVEHLFAPAATFRPLLNEIPDAAARAYWSGLIVSEQRDVMLSAGAAAVGINMTYMLPCLLLSRRWDRDFRGLAIFDLSTGMFIPFVLATSCVVIAAAQQFHTQTAQGFDFSGPSAIVPDHFAGEYSGMLAGRDKALAEAGANPAPAGPAEKRMAAVLVRRDALDLSRSLDQLFASREGEGGRLFSNLAFGVGAAGMALSSISLMMLISGFVVCDVLRKPTTGWSFRLGCLIPSFCALWPLVWQGDTRAWLTVVAGVFGAMLLPIAYVSFVILINQRKLMGSEMPSGWRGVVVNALMLFAAVAATAAGVSAIWKKAGATGMVVVAAFLLLVLIVQLARPRGGAMPDAALGATEP